MKEFIKKKPVVSYATFIVVWTWIFMAVIIVVLSVGPSG